MNLFVYGSGLLPESVANVVFFGKYGIRTCFLKVKSIEYLDLECVGMPHHVITLSSIPSWHIKHQKNNSVKLISYLQQ